METDSGPTTTERREHRPRRHVVVFWLGYLSAVAVLALVLLQFALNSRLVQARIQELVREAIPGSLTYDRLLFTLPPLRVHVFGVKLRHPTTGRALITAQEVHATWNPSLERLRRGVEVDLRDISLVDASLELLFDEQGHLSLVDLFTRPAAPDSPPSPEPGPRVSLAGIDVHNLRYLQHMAGPSLQIEAEQTRVRGNFLMENDRMTMDADVTLPRGRVALTDPFTDESLVEIPIDRLDVRGFSWRDWTFSIRQAEIASQGIAARVTGALHLGDAEEEPAFVGATELRLPLQNSFLINYFGPLLQGDLTLRGFFWGQLDHAWGGYRVRTPRLEVGEFPLEEVQVVGALDGQELQLDQVTTRLLGGHAELQGAVRLLDGLVRGRARLTRVPTEPLLPPGDLRREAAGWLSGTVQGEATLWGDGPRAVAGEVELGFERQRGNGATWPLPHQLRLQAGGQLRQDRLQLRQLSLTGGGHQLRTQGLIDLAQETLDVQLDLLTGPLGPLARWAGLPPFDGRLGFLGRVTGPWLSPRVAARVTVEELQAYGFAIDTLSSTVLLEQGQLTLADLQTGSNWGKLRLNGRIGLWPQRADQPYADPPLQVQGQLAELRLRQLLPSTAQVQGLVNAEFSASGSLAHLKAGTKLRAGPLQVRGLELSQVTAEARLQRDGRRLAVQLEQFEIKLASGGTLALKGELRPDETVRLELQLLGAPLTEVDRLAGLNTGLHGLADLRVQAHGSQRTPAITGELRLQDVRIRDEEEEPLYTLGQAEIRFELGQDQRLRVTSRQAFRHFDLEAALPLRFDREPWLQPEEAEARISFQETPLQDVIPGIGEKGVLGTVTGSLEAHLPDGEPQVRFELTQLALDILGQPLTNRHVAGEPGPRPLQLNFDGRTLRVEQFELESAGQPLSLAGQVVLEPQGALLDARLELQADGNLELKILQPFVPDLPRLAGDVGFRILVRGTLGSPELDGHLEVRDVQFQIPALDQELVLKQGRLLFTPGEIRLPASEPLLGSLGRRGAFSLVGRVELPQLVPLSIPKAEVVLYNAERLRLALPEAGLNLTFDIPRLELAGTDILLPQRKLALSGEVRLVHGQLIRDFTDPKELATAIRGWFEGLEQTGSQSLPADHPLRALKLRNVRITSEEGAFLVQVQAAILSLLLHLQPDLTITGALDALRLIGTVATQEGDSIKLRDRKFLITRSDIMFDGQTSPKVDLEAEATVVAAPLGETSGNSSLDTADLEARTYQISLFLKGRLPDDLEKFELTSPQTSDQRELWSLVVLGYRYSDLAQSGQSGALGSELLLSSALQIFSQKISEEALKRFQLVDQLSLLSQHQDVQVQVTKKMLGGKLEVIGSGTFSGAESQSSVGAKLYLRERLFLEFLTTPGSEQNPMSSRLGWQVPLAP